ncbi:MAG: hypothetical protein N2544_07475 [Burkholderiales bacterium]|nr:hypothetical protein [Burkholderiales bacterium]
MRPFACRNLLAALVFLASPCALAQGAGGLYIAGVNFTFTQAVSQALADNPAPQGRFFILAMPPATADLAASGPATDVVRQRNEALARGAQFLVCRRDVQRGVVDPATLIPGVGVVWGWSSDPNAPQPDASGLFPGEQAGWLPQSAELARRIRSTCAS